MNVLALSDVGFYILMGLAGLAGLFFVGVALGLGIWVGFGLLEARSDRKRDRAWWEWQQKEAAASTARKDAT